MNPKMNDNAPMLNTNTNPTIMDRTPTTTLIAENPVRSIAIPKNIMLSPIKMDNVAVLKIGKIIKINPNIIDNIPAILFCSIFFPPKICFYPLIQVKNVKIQKATYFLTFILFFLDYLIIIIKT